MVQLNNKEFTTRFLENIGSIIKRKRKKLNITQSQLAKFLHVDSSTLCKYEKGITDIPVSKLPLISTYCDFKITDFFTNDTSQELLDTFNKLADIRGMQYLKNEEHATTKLQKPSLLGHIYIDENGKEFTEYLTVKEPSHPKKSLSIENLLDQEPIIPFSKVEFIEYILKDEQKKLYDALTGAKLLLDCIDTDKKPGKKQKLRNDLAKYIIEDIIIKEASNGNYQAKQAYGFYKNLCTKEE